VCVCGDHVGCTDGVTRFLADLKAAASLSPTQRIKSNVIPLVAGMSFVCAYASRARRIQ